MVIFCYHTSIIYPIMDQQPTLLSRVYATLIAKGDEVSRIPSVDGKVTTGLAYVPYEAAVPVSLYFTMESNPETLIVDLLIARKIEEDRRVEVGLMLGHLNTKLTTGVFQLDGETGFVSYRQTFVTENLNLTDEQFSALLTNCENIAVEVAASYAQEMAAL